MKRIAFALPPLFLVALTGCATSALDRFVLDGHELHVSLTRKPLDGANHGLPQGVRDNPHYSTDAGVVASIARFASQGQLDGDGVRAVLYALYREQNELGFYGLEVAPTASADQLEDRLRDIWSHNVRLDRVRVHRGGPVFVVVWHDGVSPACWLGVNDGLAARLAAR